MTSIALDLEGAETTWRLNGGDGSQASLGSVEFDQCSDIHVGDAVAVGAAEVLVGDILGDALETTAGLGVEAGVDESDPPWLSHGLVDFHPVLTKVEGDVRRVEEIVGEELLDDISPVATADHEFSDAVCRIRPTDVPEQGTPTNLDHGLWSYDRLLGQSGASATGQYDRLHVGLLTGKGSHARRRQGNL